MIHSANVGWETHHSMRVQFSFPFVISRIFTIYFYVRSYFCRWIDYRCNNARHNLAFQMINNEAHFTLNCFSVETVGREMYRNLFTELPTTETLLLFIPSTTYWSGIHTISLRLPFTSVYRIYGEALVYSVVAGETDFNGNCMHHFIVLFFFLSLLSNPFVCSSVSCCFFSFSFHICHLNSTIDANTVFEQ